MATILIDSKAYEVKAGKNLLEVSLALGLDIPHFCYHPALGSVGACRLCAVRKYKDENDTVGKLVMSCMEPVTENMIISLSHQETADFRANVIEGLMTNHPHDCPVCDEGGECHLQDMTVMAGHNYRRFDFKKKTYHNQNLGPFIEHEMNRCIQCYRCVRFYNDYAGGKDLSAFSSHNHVYFGRHEEGTLENEFSGNLVEVCPTGVFTDKTLKKHFTRKWDLSNAPSVCVHCSVGCNIIGSERYGNLRRVMNRYNGAVNGYFICDRGRFGYEFVNDESRILTKSIRTERNANPVIPGEEQFHLTIQACFGENQKIVGIGSPRASLESNFALLKLVGKDNFYHGISKNEKILTEMVLRFLQKSGIHTPSLKQIEKADAVFILGEDLTNTAPMMALAVRQATRTLQKEAASRANIPLWHDGAVRNYSQGIKSPVFIATPAKDRLDDVALESFRDLYHGIAELGNSIASMIDAKAPGIVNSTEKIRQQAEQIAQSLLNAKRPLVISGINHGSREVIQSAFNIAKALQINGSDVMFSMVLPECNSMGLAFFEGKSLDDAVELSETSITDTLIVLENDLYRRIPERSADTLFGNSRKVVVLDQLMNKTAARADVLLPVSTFAGSQGTIVSNEGRAQRFYKILNEKNDEVRESRDWIAELFRIKNQQQDLPWRNFDDIVKLMADEMPVFEGLRQHMPDADFRMLNAKIPRRTMNYSGRTSINAAVSVNEPKPEQDPDSPLTFSMEGQPEKPPSSLVPFYWTPGWNSVQAMYSYLDEPNGSMKGGDPGIRLIEKVSNPEYSYFDNIPGDSAKSADEWQLFPVYRIFGSEELSSVGPAVRQRIPEPFVLIGPSDADSIPVRENELIQLETSSGMVSLKVFIENSLPPGMAGVSVNLPGMPFLDLPGNGKILKP